ncbi:MAG: MFS transporter [Pararhodobacter sp.]
MTASAPVATFAPFGNRKFLAYWLTGLGSNFGWLIQMVGASWLMTQLSGDPWMVALVQTSVAVPVMLFALPAGAAADALGRRTVVLWSQSFLLVFSVALALAAWMGMLTPWVLLGFTFLIGSAKAVNNPGWQTMASELVERPLLPQAIALGSIGFNLARTVGPAIGGLIVATVGASAAFVVNAFANIGVIFVARRWPRPERNPALPPEAVGAAIVAGLRYVAMSTPILVVLARGAIFNFGGISVMALMPVVARDLLQGGAELYGILLGAFGLGAVIGALAGNRLLHPFGLETRVRIGFTLFAVGALGLALSRDLPLSLLASMVAGASWLLTLSSFNTSVQMSAPRWVVSRCHALYQTACFAGMAAGGMLWGSIASRASISESLAWSAGVMLAGAAAGLLIGMRETDADTVDIDAAFRVPDTRLDLTPTSGPILTLIEYHVPAENENAFRAAMVERRRTRLRQGARYWTLSRDIARPEIWCERYKSANWAQTQRARARRSVADAQLTQRVRDLCDPAQPPVIRYELVRQPAAAPRPEDAIDRTIEH